VWQRPAVISPEFKGQALLIAGTTCTGLAAGEEMEEEELSPSTATGAWIKLKCFHRVGRRRFKRMSRNRDILKPGVIHVMEAPTPILQPQCGQRPQRFACFRQQKLIRSSRASSLRPQVSTQTQVVQTTLRSFEPLLAQALPYSCHETSATQITPHHEANSQGSVLLPLRNEMSLMQVNIAELVLPCSLARSNILSPLGGLLNIFTLEIQFSLEPAPFPSILVATRSFQRRSVS
jgi:hypothetical protein